MKVLTFKGKRTKDMTEEELKKVKQYYGVNEIEVESDIDITLQQIDKQDAARGTEAKEA